MKRNYKNNERCHYAIPSFKKSIRQETGPFFSSSEAQRNENTCVSVL